MPVTVIRQAAPLPEHERLGRLGEPPCPVPGPIAGLLLSWIDNRDYVNTAADPYSCWPFLATKPGESRQLNKRAHPGPNPKVAHTSRRSGACRAAVFFGVPSTATAPRASGRERRGRFADGLEFKTGGPRRGYSRSGSAARRPWCDSTLAR
jgi:hypothetical protein